MIRYSEPAPAKLNLALHVRGQWPDGRHRLETVFAFCTDGDLVEAEAAETVSMACRPSGNLPRTCSARLSLAGAPSE